MTKSGLLESIENFHQQLEANLTEISRDQMTSFHVIGTRIKDLLSHLTIWETCMTYWLRDGNQACCLLG